MLPKSNSNRCHSQCRTSMSSPILHAHVANEAPNGENSIVIFILWLPHYIFIGRGSFPVGGNCCNSATTGDGERRRRHDLKERSKKRLRLVHSTLILSNPSAIFHNIMCEQLPFHSPGGKWQAEGNPLTNPLLNPLVRCANIGAPLAGLHFRPSPCNTHGHYYHFRQPCNETILR
jgi:hypothetical protein